MNFRVGYSINALDARIGLFGDSIGDKQKIRVYARDGRLVFRLNNHFIMGKDEADNRYLKAKYRHWRPLDNCWDHCTHFRLVPYGYVENLGSGNAMLKTGTLSPGKLVFPDPDVSLSLGTIHLVCAQGRSSKAHAIPWVNTYQ